MPSEELDLVAVFETDDRIAAAMAKGLLEEAGIFYYATGEEIVQRRATRLMVSTEHAERAFSALAVLDLEPGTAEGAATPSS